MVAYAASKAGLRAFCQGLANEFAGLQVTEVMVGPTIDTEAGNRFDPHALGHWFTRWTGEGYIRFDYQLSVDVASVVLETLGSREPGARVTAAKEFS
jgi:NAD(P)-dependent dehydrogenase (short-subunit alcohol dehydrogenase family)